MTELPKGWSLATIADVTQDILNVHPEQDPTNEFGYVDISSIVNSNYSIADVKKIKGANAPSRAKRPVRARDVLFSNVRTYLRNIALVPEGSEAQICSTGFTVLRPNGAINPFYLFRWVLTDGFIEGVTPRQTGTHYPATSDRVVRSEVILLPPINEQRRIVAKLENLLSRVNAAQERLATIPRILKRFRQSVLGAACSGKLTTNWRKESIGDMSTSEEPVDGPFSLPESWQWKPLESVCESVVDCPHSTPKWTTSGRLCVRTTNFKPGYLDLSERQFVSDQTFIKRIERLRPHAGDILYSREGGILGIACMIPEGVELCLGQRMMLLRTKSDFNSSVLMHWLNSPAILERVRELTGGSASPHLNVRDIKGFPTPVPPVHEQKEIVRRIEALFKTADALEARYRTAKAHVDKLTQSILAKAFRGELVPQDPTDAPASVLLERIRENQSPIARPRASGKNRITNVRTGDR